jgi:hypothetical protein
MLAPYSGSKRMRIKDRRAPQCGVVANVFTVLQERNLALRCPRRAQSSGIRPRVAGSGPPRIDLSHFRAVYDQFVVAITVDNPCVLARHLIPGATPSARALVADSE